MVGKQFKAVQRRLAQPDTHSFQQAHHFFSPALAELPGARKFNPPCLGLDIQQLA